ncbi:hypothetical protein [Trujillonella humicola]|uniref:hypothetical protein n=1 Tax=Trujillonella humicola TaxID=3383699 RepID=UPI003905D85E
MDVEQFSFTRRRVTIVIDRERSNGRTGRGGVAVVATCSVCGASERGEVPAVTDYEGLTDLATRVAKERCTVRGHHYKVRTHRDRIIEQWHHQQLIKRIFASCAGEPVPPPNIN